MFQYACNVLTLKQPKSRDLIALSVVTCLLGLLLATKATAASLPTELDGHGLFQNLFFTASVDETLTCSTSFKKAVSTDTLTQAKDFYESRSPSIQDLAVNALLSNITESEHLKRLQELRKSCATDSEPSFCLLKSEWGNATAGLMVLVTFYDTGFLIHRENSAGSSNFTPDQINAIQKAIRKIPIYLRQIMNSARADAFTGFTIKGKKPVMIKPSSGSGLHGETVGQVFIGGNTIFLSPKLLDLAREGKKYRDLGLEFLLDFRIQLIVHEMGHVVDGLLLGNDPGTLCADIGICPIFSEVNKGLIENGRAATWPSHWWDAFSNLSDLVVDGRYEATVGERFAEYFAQCILAPEAFQASSPDVSRWMHDHVLSDTQYSGYEKCSQSTRPLGYLERLTAPKLNPN